MAKKSVLSARFSFCSSILLTRPLGSWRSPFFLLEPYQVVSHFCIHLLRRPLSRLGGCLEGVSEPPQSPETCRLHKPQEPMGPGRGHRKSWVSYWNEAAINFPLWILWANTVAWHRSLYQLKTNHSSHLKVAKYFAVLPIPHKNPVRLGSGATRNFTRAPGPAHGLT